jgi:hypothetical protein
MFVNFTIPRRGKENRKVGLIPVSTTSNETCPDACALKALGCYANGGPLSILWAELSSGTYKFGLSWSEFCERIAALPIGQLWRHNQAGDLPGENDTLNRKALRELVEANTGKRGFTYTHKPLRTRRDRDAVAAANRDGFTINLSADNLQQADTKAELGIAPVVVILPSDIQGNVKLTTPAGRRVVVCPATYLESVSCATCQLCQRAARPTIVGFPAHGASRKAASQIASGMTR